MAFSQLVNDNDCLLYVNHSQYNLRLRLNEHISPSAKMTDWQRFHYLLTESFNTF